MFWGGILKSACLSVCVSTHLSVCPYVYKIQVSVKVIAGGGINPFPNKPLFLCVCCICLLKTLGKGETAHFKQFLLFRHCFLYFWRTFSHFYQTSNCHLQTLTVWKSLKFVIWERLKSHIVTALVSPDPDPR